jgi:hypothetical protein
VQLRIRPGLVRKTSEIEDLSFIYFANMLHPEPLLALVVYASPLLRPILTEFGGRGSFSATRISLGTASGQFLRPAASRVLLSRFLPNGTGPSHKAPARLGSSGLSLLGAPGKWGKKKEKIHVLNQLSYDHRLRRRRPGAASSAEQQRLEVHRSFRRNAAVVEEHRRRMGLEDRVAPRLRVPAAARRIRRDDQERLARARRGSLVSTTYERANGKGKKAKANKQTFWCIRADVVRKLDRGEPERERGTEAYDS